MKRFYTRFNVIKYYGMVHVSILITYILLFPTFICIFIRHFLLEKVLRFEINHNFFIYMQ